MAIRRGSPLSWFPSGISDAVDSTACPPGVMASLANLIPDSTTPKQWVCRPAAIELVNFATGGGAFSSAFSSAFSIGTYVAPGAISVLKVLGTRAYGMIANGGFDQPFCYDIEQDVFITISGIVSGVNTPPSPAASGAWMPPTMDLIGATMIVTHPGFTGVGTNFFGVINLSNPAAPTWNVQNTATNALPSPPVAVKQFNNRAWFAVNPSTGTPGLYFSNVLDALTITAGTQVLTFGDNVKLTALGALPLQNQLGGVVQSLIVFKGAQNMYQVTGDAVGSTLAQNALNIATGTLAPNSICPTPKGLAFMAPDGMRIIDFKAQVSEPIGNWGQGVTVPFIYAVVPSRVAAACAIGLLRVSVQNGYAGGNPTQEYWFDMSKGLWSGPHTFPAGVIQPYNNTFIMAGYNVNAKLWQSDCVQSSTSTFVENGTQLSYTYRTSLLPNTGRMAENSVSETTVDLALDSSQPNTSVIMTDGNGAVLASVLYGVGGSPTIWGSFTWGAATWGGGASNVRPRRIDWPNPIVSSQFTLQVTGNAAAGIKIGKSYFRYEQLGYLAA